MNKWTALRAFILVVGAVYLSWLHLDQIPLDKIPASMPGEHFIWCTSNYHQTTGCLLKGIMPVPERVLAEREAGHLEWCDEIYHQNVGCPLHGKVEIPPEVKARQEAEHLEWCKELEQWNKDACPELRIRPLEQNDHA